MLTLLLIFTALNILLAYIDARRIAKRKTIRHGVNGAIYVALAIVACFILYGWSLLFVLDSWLLFFILCFDRLLFFNIPLSKFRKLRWDYVSLDPESIIDAFAMMIFGLNGRKMYTTYGVIFVLLILAFIIF